jgi:hypothetical protein
MQLHYSLALVLASTLAVAAAPWPVPSGTPKPQCPYTCPVTSGTLNWIFVGAQRSGTYTVKCEYFSIGLDPTLHTCTYDTQVSGIPPPPRDSH